MSEPRPTLLVIEDERQIRRFVAMALEGEGFRVVEADSVKRGLIDAGTHTPDAVILDLGLPDADGGEFIKQFRAWSTAPVVVLSARSNEQDKVAALDLGADDYLTKPFGTAELLARVRAQLRRTAHTQPDAHSTVCFGRVCVDLALRTVTRDGEPVALTPIEYCLLVRFLSDPGKVLTHRQLLRDVWGPHDVDKNHYLRVFIGTLRRKLEDDSTQPVHFVTETGVGYRFVL